MTSMGITLYLCSLKSQHILNLQKPCQKKACVAAMKPVGDTLDHDYAMVCETLPIDVELGP